MRSLIRKELGELFAVVALAFVLLCVLLFGSRGASPLTLIVPEDFLAESVFTMAAIAGVVLGYLQFAKERWMAKTAYLLHRGTGRSAVFSAKVVAGLGAALVLSLGPLLVFALARKFLSDNGPLVRFDRVVEPACAAAFAATAYGVGVLSAQVRRHPVAEIVLAIVGIWGAMLLAGCVLDLAPASVPEALAVPAISQLVLGGILLVLARRLFLDDVDRELAIRRGPLGALALLAVPILVLPTVVLVASLQGHFLSNARRSDAILLRDDADGSIFAVRPDRDREFRRLDARGEFDRTAPELRPSGQDVSYETLYPSQDGFRSHRGIEFPNGKWEGIRDNYARHMLPGGSMHEFIGNPPKGLSVFFDRTHHVLRIYGLVEAMRSSAESTIRRTPFELELGKPPSGALFSDDTRVLRGLARTPPSTAELSQLLGGLAPAGDLMCSCIVDPADGSLWSIDLNASSPALVPHALPDGDRFVRLEPLYMRGPGSPGQRWRSWNDAVVRGAKGTYQWDGAAFRNYEPTSTLALEADVQSRIGAHAVATATDPLATRIEIQSNVEDRVLFTWDFGPRNVVERFYASLAQGLTLLRPPLANVIASAQPAPTEATSYWQRNWFVDPLLVGGRRFALLAASLVLGLASALWTLRCLRRQNTALPTLALWTSVVFLVGPIAFLVARMFEARRSQALEVEPKAALQRELLIESA